MSLRSLLEKMGWATTPKKKSQKRAGKLSVAKMDDGRRHRVDENGIIVGKTALRRYHQALRKSAKASKGPVGSPEIPYAQSGDGF